MPFVSSFLRPIPQCLLAKLSLMLFVVGCLLLPKAARAQVTYTGSAGAWNFGSQAIFTPSADRQPDGEEGQRRDDAGRAWRRLRATSFSETPLIWLAHADSQTSLWS